MASEQIAEPLVLRHRRRAVALAEPLLVGAENQRDVRELGRRLAERAPEQDVLWRIRDVIVAADDVRDLHIEIVGDDRQVIRRQPVRSKDDEVLDLRVVELDRRHGRDPRTTSCPAALGNESPAATPAASRRCRSSFGKVQGSARSYFQPPPAFSAVLTLSASTAPARNSICMRGLSASSFVRDVAMPLEPLRLESTARAARRRRGPSSHSRPSQRIDSRMPATMSFGRSLGVGVFDAQNERSAVTPAQTAN